MDLDTISKILTHRTSDEIFEICKIYEENNPDVLFLNNKDTFKPGRIRFSRPLPADYNVYFTPAIG